MRAGSRLNFKKCNRISNFYHKRMKLTSHCKINCYKKIIKIKFIISSKDTSHLYYSFVYYNFRYFANLLFIFYIITDSPTFLFFNVIYVIYILYLHTIVFLLLLLKNCCFVVITRHTTLLLLLVLIYNTFARFPSF